MRILPRVSIITVVKNGEKYLQQCLNSIFEQNYSNMELLVLDGASNDRTCQIIEENIKKIDLFYSESDQGLSDAMNKAVKRISGEYVVFLHSDDVFTSKNSVSYLVDKLLETPQANNVYWVTGFYNYIDAKSNLIKSDRPKQYTFKSMLMRNVVRHQSTMVQRNVFQEISFCTDLKFAMDYLFFLNLWYRFGPPLYVMQHITNFRLDGENLSSNYFFSIQDEMFARLKFRYQNSQKRYIIFDFFIYFLRCLKLFLFHFPRRWISNIRIEKL